MQHWMVMRTLRTNPWALAVLIWIGAIFFSSTSVASRWCNQGFAYLFGLLFGNLGTDGPPYGLLYLITDKGFHVFLFLILAVLLWKAIPAARWKIVEIIVFGAFIGSCSEFLQRFFPGRDPAVRDVLINTGGTALGVAMSLMLARSQRGDSSLQSLPSEDESVLAEKG